jgi:folate-dependent phosphoribosylglycinamide formyltransferase PurN
VLEQPVSRGLLFRRRVQKLGLLHVLGQLMFQGSVAPLLTWCSRARVRDIIQLYGLEVSPAPADKTSNVDSVNSEESIQLIRLLEPAAIVIAGTRILSKRFLASISCPVVNIHAGITPLYRGVHGAYWALAEQRRGLCGVTVHRVDAGIDTGKVLGQVLLTPGHKDNFATYPWIQIGEGLILLAQLLPRVVRGEDVAVEPLVRESRLRYHPAIWTYLWNRLVHGVK